MSVLNSNIEQYKDYHPCTAGISVDINNFPDVLHPQSMVSIKESSESVSEAWMLTQLRKCDPSYVMIGKLSLRARDLPSIYLPGAENFTHVSCVCYRQYLVHLTDSALL